jgi:mycothiol synthase
VHDFADIETFLERLSQHQGYPPLSAAKSAMLGEPSAVAVVAEDRRIVGVGVVASHPQQNGPHHWAVETAVEPSLQFVQFERAVLEATLELVPRGAPRSVWANRSATSDAARALGFHEVRSLAYMVVDLPVEGSVGGQSVRPFRDSDRSEIVAVNNLAFAGHREAGSMSEEEFLGYTGEPWFDPSGIVVLEVDGAIIGFCWTKVHENGDGEIFRIGVDPQHHGRGFGRVLLTEGFRLLSANDRVRRGSLWVDESNAVAMGLYGDTGMRVERTIREFEPSA